MPQDIMADLQKQCAVNTAGTGNSRPGFPAEYLYKVLLLIR